MKFLSSNRLLDLLRFASDPRRQTEGGRLTLTVLEVEQISGEASLSPDVEAVQEARRIKRPARRRADEERGFWELTQGTYWVTFNERIEVPPDGALLIQAHPDLLRNGVWHPTLMVRNWDREGGGVLMVVMARGVKISEGSPISVGYVFD